MGFDVVDRGRILQLHLISDSHNLKHFILEELLLVKQFASPWTQLVLVHIRIWPAITTSQADIHQVWSVIYLYIRLSVYFLLSTINADCKKNVHCNYPDELEWKETSESTTVDSFYWERHIRPCYAWYDLTSLFVNLLLLRTINFDPPKIIWQCNQFISIKLLLRHKHTCASRPYIGMARE
jgi:hypothetical protein